MYLAKGTFLTTIALTTFSSATFGQGLDLIDLDPAPRSGGSALYSSAARGGLTCEGTPVH